MAEGIRSSTGEHMKDLLDQLAGAGARIFVCKACADKRLVSPDELIPAASIMGGPELVRKMADPEARVLTF
jgi:uncharacterized protein involved in oxidation of intracellular sulfur